MSVESLRAAKKLLDEGYLRRSVSSAYYAAYSALAGDLVVRGVTFAHGWSNSSHDQLPELVLYNTTFPRGTRFTLNRVLRRLRAARESADYRPRVLVDLPLARGCVRDAILVLYLLGITE